VLHLSIFISVINQLDAQHFCFTISLFHASTMTLRCDDTRGCVMQFWPPDYEHMCSKHVEAWNKLIVKQKFCASIWLITEINILRCTVSKTIKICKYICKKWDLTSTMCMYAFLICSNSQPHGNPIGSKYVAVWILHKVVFDGYLYIPHVIRKQVLHPLNTT